MRHLKTAFIIIIVLVFALGAGVTAASVLDNRAGQAEAAERSAELASALEDGSVSLYEVDTINNRVQTLSVTDISGEEDNDGLVAQSLAYSAEADTLTTREFLLDDIPVLEVWEDDGTEKPLLIFLHGVCLDKESVLPALEAYAQAGYHAVSIDAYNQGSRYSEDITCDDWAAMLITVSDVDTVITYYSGVDNVSIDNFVLGGFSMGAIETWVYKQIGAYEPAALMTMCGICEYEAWQPWMRMSLSVCWIGDKDGSASVTTSFQNLSYTNDKIDAITSVNITANLEDYADIPIFACVGDMDWYFNDDDGETALQAIVDAGNDNVTYMVYQHQIHELTDQMISDSLSFLETLATQTVSEQSNSGFFTGLLSAMS